MIPPTGVRIPFVLMLSGVFAVGCLVADLAHARAVGHVLQREDRVLLRGGSAESDHFDITEFRLNPNQLNFGLGREAFQALIEPAFDRPGDAGVQVADHTRVLGVVIQGEAKAYPINILRRHEVVNDTVGGRPVFAAYCVLADLAGVYDREMGGHVYTFAVSGYTYVDDGIWDGLEAFVLWDRDTESLWLPTIGKGVSGPMIDVPLRLTPGEFWADTTWGKFHRQFPDAVILKDGQTMASPEDFPKFEGPYPERTSISLE